MAEAKFKVGDIVVLKSGSPKMTINAKGQKYSTDLRPIGFDGTYTCVWFEKNKNFSADFAEATLEAASDSSDD